MFLNMALSVGERDREGIKSSTTETQSKMLGFIDFYRESRMFQNTGKK